MLMYKIKCYKCGKIVGIDENKAENQQRIRFYEQGKKVLCDGCKVRNYNHWIATMIENGVIVPDFSNREEYI